MAGGVKTEEVQRKKWENVGECRRGRGGREKEEEGERRSERWWCSRLPHGLPSEQSYFPAMSGQVLFRKGANLKVGWELWASPTLRLTQRCTGVLPSSHQTWISSFKNKQTCPKTTGQLHSFISCPLTSMKSNTQSEAAGLEQCQLLLISDHLSLETRILPRLQMPLPAPNGSHHQEATLNWGLATPRAYLSQALPNIRLALRPKFPDCLHDRSSMLYTNPNPIKF